MPIVYPKEVWPADAATGALDGVTDERTGLPYIAKGTGPTSVPSYEAQYNRRQHRQNQILATWRQGMVVDEGNLTIGVYPMGFVLGGVARSYWGATGVAIPDNSGKVVYLDEAAALQVEDVWPSDVTTFVPLAIISASNGSLSIGDYRGQAAFHVPSLDAASVRDRRIVTASRASVASAQADVQVFAWDAPEDLELDEVQVYCGTATATVSVDVKVAGASMLSSAATPLTGSVVKPTVSNANVSAAQTVGVHVTTDGTGSLADLTVTLLFKAALSA